MIDAVYAASEKYDDVVIAVHFAHGALRAFERAKGVIGSTVRRIISRGRDCNCNRRGTEGLRKYRWCPQYQNTGCDNANCEGVHSQRSTSSMRKQTSSLYRKLC
jgi:hypothetical protein